MHSSCRTSALGRITLGSYISYYCLMFFIAYAFKGQVHVFAGRMNIVSHSSCRTSAILKYFCPLIRETASNPPPLSMDQICFASFVGHPLTISAILFLILIAVSGFFLKFSYQNKPCLLRPFIFDRSNKNVAIFMTSREHYCEAWLK